MSRITLLVLVIAVCGCQATPSPSPRFGVAPLLDGQTLFGTDVPAADDTDVLGLSAGMLSFLETNVRGVGNDWIRLKRLLAGMGRGGFFDLDYDTDRTLTAAETFAAKRGNCLSFTNLFVALARASGLDARYQIVDVPPIWDSLDGWVILNSHIDVVVRGVHEGARGSAHLERDYLVDFNMADFQTAYPRRIVKDETAFALFYNNRGVEMMRAGDLRGAFANFKRAIASDSNESSVWVNLGALYSRQRQYAQAEAAYQRALAVDGSDRTAMSNLARIYDQIGDADRAGEYRRRIARYQNINPYYHYALAERAYAEADYPVALDEIDRAIALKKDDHRFFFLEALVHYEMGDVENARSSLTVAERLSDEDAIKRRYADKLAALGLRNG